MKWQGILIGSYLGILHFPKVVFLSVFFRVIFIFVLSWSGCSLVLNKSGDKFLM